MPGSNRGRPGGAHSKGELYMGSSALFVCGKGGTGRKVSTTKS